MYGLRILVGIRKYNPAIAEMAANPQIIYLWAFTYFEVV
jgi:hypothetical protein